MRVSTRLLALAALLAGAPLSAHAVTVSPNALFIDSRTRSGVLTLYNPGTTAEEIEITFAFGYPRSDLAGAISVALADTAPAGEPSVLGFVRAFPRRLRLEPGQRQTVRILMQPPAGLPEGEYWGRVLIHSRGGRPPVEQQQGGIRMQIDLETVIVGAVNYRNGTMHTGVHIDSARATVSPRGDSVRVVADISRLGNAAYLGHMTLELVSAEGKVLGTTDEDFALYRGLRKVESIAVPTGAPLNGATVRYRFTTERPDIDPESRLAGEAVTGTVPLSR
jgi:P pilus assembly protein, chaperone PapD